MTTEQIIEYLRHYNEWRRGNNAPQPDPTEVGKAIDAACEALQTLERERDEARENLKITQEAWVEAKGDRVEAFRERDEARSALRLAESDRAPKDS
jgi:hypothetical protein